MKTIFVSVKSKEKPNYLKIRTLIKKNISEKKIAICYSNQFISVAEKLEKILDEKVLLKIQILGCSNPKFPKNVEAILLIGQGKFHSVSLAYESKLPVYLLENSTITKVLNEEIEKLEKKEKGQYLKYLHSEKVGILVTNKPGQERLKEALKFHKNLKNKKSYLFIANDLDVSEFENFGLDSWVNTACPRMDLTEGNIINLEKLKKLNSGH